MSAQICFFGLHLLISTKTIRELNYIKQAFPSGDLRDWMFIAHLYSRKMHASQACDEDHS